jgi:CRISPR-associated endoribonuclease Cas6
MRFRLILEVNKNAFGNIIPINYQYEQSAVIYHILSRASEEYSHWLHDNGYALARGKRFKLFCFSRLKIEKRQILAKEERIRILSNTIEWQISFLPEKSTEKFIQGLFANQTFEIGDKTSTVQFHVRNVEVLPQPKYTNEMEFSTMSPICLRCQKEEGGAEYISPSDSRAQQAILTGLLSRYQAFYGVSFSSVPGFQFTVLDEPKSVLVKLRAGTTSQTQVRGYMCQFKLKAPVELMKTMYEAGIGEECSQGFGCVQLKKLK